MKVEITADDVLGALAQAADDRRRYEHALYAILSIPVAAETGAGRNGLLQWRDEARRLAQDALGVAP